MLSAKRLPSDQQRKDPLLVIVLSIIVCSVLVVYPLSYGFAGWRPLLMMMVMLYWVLCQPTWCSVWFAFALGIFTDLLLDMPLGMNALSFVLITFITRFFTRERRIMTFANTWIIATMAIVAHVLFTLMMQVVADIQFSLARHWQPVLSSILLWPLLYQCLKRWRL